MTKQTVVTPDGAFFAEWEDIEDSTPRFTGSEAGIQYFRQFMDVARVTGDGGMPLSVDDLSPEELYGFCQSERFGVTVHLSIEDQMARDEQQANEQANVVAGMAQTIAQSDDPDATLAGILDAVSPLDRIKLLRALSDATAGLKASTSPIARVKAAKAVADALAALGINAGGDADKAPGEDPQDDGLSDDPSSPNYRYKDTGYIADSRKEKAAAMLRDAKSKGQKVRVTDIDWNAIEANPRQAKELIVKSNLFGKTDWDALRASGMDPGAGFLIDKVYASIGPEPVNAIPITTIKAISRDMDMIKSLSAMDRDSPEAMAQTRKDYALGLETIRDRMEKCKTVDDVMTALAEIKDELFGTTLSSDQADAMAVLSAKMEDLYAERKAYEDRKSELWGAANEIGREIRSLTYQQQKRASRKWKPDPEIAKQIAELEVRHKPLEDAARAFTDANPRFKTEWNDLAGLPRSPFDLEQDAVRAQASQIRKAAFAYNMLSNTVSRAWLSLGERFLNLVNFRSYKGSEAFSGHYTAARSGKVKDWSWAEKTGRAPGGKKPTGESIAFQLRVADNYERIGGKQVPVASTTALKDMLGLRDVQSGNWVLRDQTSAKFHVEQTAAAMSDMADVLGIDMKHLGLGGRLAMAFGARGTGGKGAARAHYEPVERVINLTKMGGGGALGHELFHAIDNILPPIAAGKVGDKGDFASKDPENLPAGRMRDAFTKLQKVMMTGNVRLSETIKIGEKDRATAILNIDRVTSNPVVKVIKAAGDAEAAVLAVDAYFGTRSDRNSLRSKKQWRTLAAAYYSPEGTEKVRLKVGMAVSNFMAGAQELDGGSTAKYWSTPEEMAARAFQSYLEDRLADQGRRNDYLSVFADNKHHVDPLFGIEWKPYPEGEERTRINAAFDELFAVLRDEKVFEKASQDKALLDAIFGLEPGDDAVLDSAEVIAAREALEQATTPMAKIMATKALAAAIEQSKANAFREANASGKVGVTGNGPGSESNPMANLPTDNKYLNRAMESFSAGFTSEAAKKEAMSYLGRAYDSVRNGIQELVLAIDNDARTEDQNEVYWGLPSNLNNWRQKHADLVLRVFPGQSGAVATIAALVDLRAKFAGAEVVKPVPKDQRERERVAAAMGSKDPSINDIVAKLRDLKPVVAKEFRESVTPTVHRLVQRYQSGEDMKAFFKDNEWLVGHVQFIMFDGSPSQGKAVGVDEAKIEKESISYADLQVETMIHKLLSKIGNLTEVQVHNLRADSMEFSLTGKLGESKVSIFQQRIINTSVKGQAYHQWPARITVDGKAVSEAQYRGLSGNEGTGKPEIKVGSKVKVGSRVVEVIEIRYAIARGVGPGINGQSVEHVFWKEGDKVRSYPKRYARLVES